MPFGRARPRRPGVVLMPTVMSVARAAAGVTVLVSLLVGTAGVSSAAPRYSLDDRAAAIVSPAVVYVESQTRGYLRRRSNGALVDPKPVVVTHRCSGIVVDTDGYAVTVTHCVRPTRDALRGSAAYLVTDRLIHDGKVKSSDRSDHAQHLIKTTDFTGATADTRPTTKVYAQTFVATDGLTSAPAVSAAVVDAVAIEDGGVALIKMDKTGLPVAKLDGVTLATGTNVVQVAFSRDDSGGDVATYLVRSRSSTVAGRYGTSSPPLFSMDGDLGDAAYGGPVVNVDGHVIGMINSDVPTGHRTNDLVTPVSTITPLLDKAGIKNEQTATDQAYLDGLDAYYAGRYADAIAKFDEVLAADPAHKPAQDFRDLAKKRLEIEGGGGMPTWLASTLAGVGGAVVVAVIALVVALVRRRRRRMAASSDPFAPSPLYTRDSFGPRPYGADPFLPVSGAPISGSPISGYPVSGYPVSGPPPGGYPPPGSAPPGSGGYPPPSPSGPAYPPVPPHPPEASVPPGPGYPRGAGARPGPGYPAGSGYPPDAPGYGSDVPPVPGQPGPDGPDPYPPGAGGLPSDPPVGAAGAPAGQPEAGQPRTPPPVEGARPAGTGHPAEQPTELMPILPISPPQEAGYPAAGPGGYPVPGQSGYPGPGPGTVPGQPAGSGGSAGHGYPGQPTSARPGIPVAPGTPAPPAAVDWPAAAPVQMSESATPAAPDTRSPGGRPDSSSNDPAGQAAGNATGPDSAGPDSPGPDSAVPGAVAPGTGDRGVDGPGAGGAGGADGSDAGGPGAGRRGSPWAPPGRPDGTE